MNFSEQIKQLRINKNETLHKVSMGTNIDMTVLSKIERGKRYPTVKQLKQLAKYFNTSEADLKSKLISEKIIKDYGMNITTYNAVQLVNEILNCHIKKE